MKWKVSKMLLVRILAIHKWSANYGDLLLYWSYYNGGKAGISASSTF